MGQKPTYKYNVISHKTVLRQKNAKKRPDRKEDLATPSRKRSLGQLGNLSRSVARASQEPRAGHWALAGQDAQRSQQPGKPQRELPAHPLAATMGSGPKSRGAIHGAMRSGGGGRCGRWWMVVVAVLWRSCSCGLVVVVALMVKVVVATMI